jgi:hypothetical protein
MLDNNWSAVLDVGFFSDDDDDDDDDEDGVEG